MITSENLVLKAVKKEHKRLVQIALKAKLEVDEYMEIGNEYIAIYKEFAVIVKSGTHTKSQIKKLAVLSKRSERVEKIRKKDLIKLLDKQSSAEFERDSLGQEVEMLNLRYQIRNNNL